MSMSSRVAQVVFAGLFAGACLVSAGGVENPVPREQRQQRRLSQERPDTRRPSTSRPAHLCAAGPLWERQALAPAYLERQAAAPAPIRSLPPPAPPAPSAPPPPPAPEPPAASNAAPRMAADGGAFVGRPVTLPSDFNTEEYGVIDEAGFVSVRSAPLSTFSIDVDTAAYANVRRFLRDGSLPPADAVRIEELINYFDYDYPQPQAGVPFGIVTEMADTPWAPAHRLVHVGLRSTPVATADLPPNNLVFLLDVSGSMSAADKLPLLKEALALLVGQLRPQDQVTVVVYAGAAGMVLSPTSGARKATILDTLSRLEAGGRRLAGPASASLTSWRASTSSRTATTGSFWRPTATSTSGCRATESWSS